MGVGAVGFSVEQQGVSYAFCCNMCQQAFTENPARFTAENHL